MKSHAAKPIAAFSSVAASLTAGLIALVLCISSCTERGVRDSSSFDGSSLDGSSLRARLYSLTDSVPGTVGIAFVGEGDTVTVNNGVHFPMMSVFKLHQSLAVAEVLRRDGVAIDSVIHVRRSELNPDTWSPMLKDYRTGDFDISVRDLVKYALRVSDNNASNLLFDHIVSPSETDSIIRRRTADGAFAICFSEAEMQRNHSLAYANYTSPLSAALLISEVFGSGFQSDASLDSIRVDLTAVTTGHDRLGSILNDCPELFFAHKTGSGYRNEVGELAAHNDVGFFRLPDGREYAVAVFIRDFSGTEAQASDVIACISSAIYDYVARK